MRRIPSLDGLRAISILAVLSLHLSDMRGFLTQDQIHPFNFGFLGVWTFFVISGFLITTLLLDELDKTGRISLREFYFRRSLRIFPPFYAYLLFLAIGAAAGWFVLGRWDLLTAATYTANYAPPDTSWYVAHLWSLSVEEQFYLLWPAVLVWLGRRHAFWAAAAVCVVVPACRVVHYLWFPERIMHSFETVADALAIGCLLAGCRDWLWAQPGYRRLLQSPLMVVAPLLAVCTAGLFTRPRVFYALGTTLFCGLIALTIDWATRFPATPFARVLNWRPLVYIGTLSYSLYLWQQPWLTQTRWPERPWAWFPLNLCIAFVFALGSFYLIEKPSLAWRKRFSARRDDEILAAANASAIH